MAVYRCRTGPLLIGFSSSDSHMCMSVLVKARADHVLFLFVCLFVCWSLLYSSQADSLRSRMILHELLAFHSVFNSIHQSGVLTALVWLVPSETAAVSARSVYTTQPCTMPLHACC